jgi:type I restriction enzyme S subunit
MAMNQSCYAIQPKLGTNSFYLHQCVNDFVKYLKAKANGSIFDAIVSNDFKQTPIVIPTIEIIKAFGFISENIYEKILNNRSQNQTLAELRDWLLPMLMNGQVQVTPNH